jgi:hypothetical protein
VLPLVFASCFCGTAEPWSSPADGARDVPLDAVFVVHDSEAPLRIVPSKQLVDVDETRRSDGDDGFVRILRPRRPLEPLRYYILGDENTELARVRTGESFAGPTGAIDLLRVTPAVIPYDGGDCGTVSRQLEVDFRVDGPVSYLELWYAVDGGTWRAARLPPDFGGAFGAGGCDSVPGGNFEPGHRWCAAMQAFSPAGEPSEPTGVVCSTVVACDPVDTGAGEPLVCHRGCAAGTDAAWPCALALALAFGPACYARRRLRAWPRF